VRGLYSGKADIDDPFAGHQVDGAFEDLVRNWGPTRHATVRSITVDHSTVSDRFAGIEITLNCDQKGTAVAFPIVVVSELGEGGKFVRTRMYYRRALLDGVQHWRERLLDEPIKKRSYNAALDEYHNALDRGSAQRMLDAFTDDNPYFDGHGGALDLSLGLGMGLYEGKPAMRKAFEQMFGIIEHEGGTGGGLEHVNAFTDGTTTVVEFTIIHPNHPSNRVHSGVACYELAPDGKLKAARVYDEAL
jgi:hypothetical protein